MNSLPVQFEMRYPQDLFAQDLESKTCFTKTVWLLTESHKKEEMKIAKKIRVQETQAGAIVLEIPFEREPTKAPVKGEYHTYKLRTQPTDSSSPVYDLSVPVFDHGTPEV